MAVRLGNVKSSGLLQHWPEQLYRTARLPENDGHLRLVDGERFLPNEDETKLNLQAGD